MAVTRADLTTDIQVPDDVVLFDPPPPRRSLSAPDIVRLLVGLAFVAIGLVLAAYAERTIAGIEGDIVDAIDSVPNKFEQTVLAAAQLIATFVPLVAIVVTAWHRRWMLLFSLFTASVVASSVTTLLLLWLGERDVASLLAERSLQGSPLVASDFPTSGYVASAVAAATVGVAHLPRRWKRATWSWVTVLLVLRLLGPGQPPLDVWIAVSLGVVVGSLVLLVFGSPNPEPSPQRLLRSLYDVGLDPIQIERRNLPGNHATYDVFGRDGSEMFVKLRTPDDRSWDLLSRLYRMLRLRSSELSRPYSTLKRRVEHEALVLRTVRDGNTKCPGVVTIGVTSGGAAFLVEERVTGVQLDEVDPADFDDDLVRQVLAQVAAMHGTRTAHRGLTLDNFMLDADRVVWTVDFDEAELAADHHQRSRDVAEILVALALVVGPERTVDAAIDVLGQQAVAGSLTMLQPLALARSLGKSIRSRRDLLDELRRHIHDRTGVDDVPLEQLERVKPRTLVMIMAGALAFYSLLPQFGNLGDTVNSFGDARGVWLPPLLLASAIYFVFATVSFLGSVAQPMSVAASGRSQLATAFAQLVGPASSGKMALAGRFLQRNGLTAAEASASVALNTIAGVLTHLLLMVGFFAWAGGADIGGVSLPSLGTILVVIGVAVVLIAIASAIAPIRRRVVLPVIDGLRTAAGYVREVIRSPIRVAALIGGSACITLSYVAASVFAVEAMGGDLTVAQIGASYLGAAAIANIAPTPGGLGALEAGMIAALTGFGLEGGIAISAVLTFRLATFWLPILPGWLTFMWMERRGEI